MAKKKKDLYVPKTGILGNAIDYNYYKMSVPTRIGCFIAGAAAGFILGYIFYEQVVLASIAAVICGCAFQPVYHKRFMDKRKRQLLLQFRDMLESLNASIGAGSNIQDSFLAAYKDMEVQYTESGYITKELGIIIAGMQNNIGIEALLSDFGERSGITDIISFADVFETSYQKGGNIKDIIKNTYQIIRDKIEIEIEIKTVVSSKTSEQNMMMVMPVLLVLLLKFTASDIINLNSATGRMSTTMAMVIFAVAYLMSRKILSIKV